MKKLFKRSFLCLALLLPTLVGANPGQKSLFHTDPSFTKLEHHVNTITQFMQRSPTAKAETKEHMRSVLNVYLTAAFHAHPEYVQELKKRFPDYPKAQQALWANAVVFAKDKELIATLDKDWIASNITTIQDVKTLDVRSHDTIHLTDNTDYLWAAYDVTGDPKHIAQILEFLASRSNDIRDLAFTMLQREQMAAISGQQPDYTDIIEKVNTKMPNNPNYKEDLITYKIILWSTLSQMRQHPEIEKTVNEIVSKKPALAKIFEASSL